MDNTATPIERAPRTRRRNKAVAAQGITIVGMQGITESLMLTEPSIWSGVRKGTIPPPFYPQPKSPRWVLEQVIAHMAKTCQMTPAEKRRRHAEAKRKAAKAKARALAHETSETPEPTEPHAAAEA
jgi:hypothetical protein